MIKKLKGKTQIQIYTVVSKQDLSKFLTLVNTKDQCREFVSNIFKVERREHYLSWCDLKEVDADDASNWECYYNTCVSPVDKNEYLIKPITYQWQEILGIMRMFGGCVPIGSSFDTAMEKLYFQTLMETKKMYEAYLDKSQSKQECTDEPEGRKFDA